MSCRGCWLAFVFFSRMQKETVGYRSDMLVVLPVPITEALACSEC
jgi:hypothetical protein